MRARTHTYIHKHVNKHFHEKLRLIAFVYGADRCAAPRYTYDDVCTWYGRMTRRRRWRCRRKEVRVLS